jgi:hypothetical protein
MYICLNTYIIFLSNDIDRWDFAMNAMNHFLISWSISQPIAPGSGGRSGLALGNGLDPV